MNVQGTIHQVQPSKSGKSLSVVVDGKRFSAKLNSGLMGSAGKTITFDPTEQKLDDGGVIRWINEFTLSGGAAGGASASGPAAMPQGGAIQGGAPSSYQPLVSNLAAHLIAAGKDPAELGPWFYRCKALLEGKDEEPQF
jgi:hypothetical protein